MTSDCKLGADPPFFSSRTPLQINKQTDVLINGKNNMNFKELATYTMRTFLLVRVSFMEKGQRDRQTNGLEDRQAYRSINKQTDKKHGHHGTCHLHNAHFLLARVSLIKRQAHEMEDAHKQAD